MIVVVVKTSTHYPLLFCRQMLGFIERSPFIHLGASDATGTSTSTSTHNTPVVTTSIT